MRFHNRRLLDETGIHRSVPRKGRAMDRLEAISIVLAVAEASSLSAAARRLNTPPTTASRKITELEEHLCAKLHIYPALAEKERALIAERTRASLAQKKAQGAELGNR